ncbi:MAG: MFS transporter [Verrucomicrobia bacterium]|nr:MFS transporter [Verrucomicrobiota bacterium]
MNLAPGPTPDSTAFAPPANAAARARWLALLAAFLGWMFDGFEQAIFPLIANPALTELTGGAEQAKNLWNGYITASWLLGAACGGLVFGWLGDRLGRVRAMSMSILLYSLFTGLGYFAGAPWQLAALRFVASLGMGGEWALGVALVMECWPDRWRPLLAGAIGAAANVGYLVLGTVGYFFPVTPHSWRWVLLAGTAPALLTFLILFFVPESERWKQSVTRAVSRPTSEIFSPALRSQTVLAIVFASVALIGTWGSVQQIPFWVDKQLAHGHPTAKAVAQAASGVGAILGCLIAPLLGGRIGRRPAYFLLCLSSLAASSALFWGMHSYNALFVLMVGVVGGVTAAFYGWLPLYLPELFPTRVRATGQGVSYNSGRIFAALAALNLGPIVNFYAGNYARMCGTITLVYVLGLVFIWFAPETKGRPLPE